MITFSSDNYATVCPEVMAALERVNSDHAPAYGRDEVTSAAKTAIQQALGDSCPLWFVGTGTAANTLALKAVLRSHESVICADSSHMITHESGAPHQWVGCKFISIPHHNGKISSAQIRQAYNAETAWGPHATQPRLVSISQTSEYGSVYRLQELREIRELCDELQLILHVDGCRLYNAAAALECDLGSVARLADVLSLGGTKAGMMFGEAVVFPNHDLAGGFDHLQKQGLQMFSKMRYVSAQFLALFSDDLGLNMARETNRLTSLLARGLQERGVELAAPVESNMVFVKFPPKLVEALRAHTAFHDLPGTGVSRLILSHDVSETDIEEFLSEVDLQFGA